MARSPFSLFRPANRAVLTLLHRAMYPSKSTLQISKDLLIRHNIRRVTTLSPKYSDHIGYIAKDSGIFSYNMMKLGGPRNNAFAKIETPDEYRDRVIKLANFIATKILENPDINHYLAQEAPIGENYEIFKEIINQRLSNKWVCHNTDYGVLTMVNTEKFLCRDVSDELNLTSGMDFRYKDARFRAFEITEAGKEPYILINLHAPHDNQGDTLKLFIENVIRELGTCDRKVLICGDWNATPREIGKSIKDAYKDVSDSLDEYNFPCPISIKTKYSSSYSGHQKALKEGQVRPDFLSVDGVLTMNFKEGFHFEFEQEEEDYTKNFNLGVSLAVISGIGLLFTNEDDDEDEEEEQDKKSSSPGL